MYRLGVYIKAQGVPADWDIQTGWGCTCGVGVWMRGGTGRPRCTHKLGLYLQAGMYVLQVHNSPHQAALSFSCSPLRRDAFAAEVRAHFFPNVSVDLCESNHCRFPHLAVLIVQQLADGWYCLGQVKTSGAIPVPGKVQQVLMPFVRVCFHSCTTTWRLSQN